MGAALTRSGSAGSAQTLDPADRSWGSQTRASEQPGRAGIISAIVVANGADQDVVEAVQVDIACGRQRGTRV